MIEMRKIHKSDDARDDYDLSLRKLSFDFDSLSRPTEKLSLKNEEDSDENDFFCPDNTLSGKNDDPSNAHDGRLPNTDHHC